MLLLTVCKLKPSSIIRVTAHFTPRKGPLLHQHGDSLRFQHASLITGKQSGRREVIHLVFECTPPLLIPRSIPEVCVNTLKLRSDAVIDFFRVHKLPHFWRCPVLRTILCKRNEINVNNWPTTVQKGCERSGGENKKAGDIVQCTLQRMGEYPVAAPV